MYFCVKIILSTVFLVLNASPYGKNSGIIPIPINGNSVTEEKIVGIPTIKGFLIYVKTYR